jgi:hypothetical protein
MSILSSFLSTHYKSFQKGKKTELKFFPFVPCDNDVSTVTDQQSEMLSKIECESYIQSTGSALKVLLTMPYLRFLRLYLKYYL